MPSSPMKGQECQENFEESEKSFVNEQRIESPTNFLSPTSKPHVQNMEIRFRREAHLDSNHLQSIQVTSMAPLHSRAVHKNFKSEIKKSFNSNMGSF